jgi:hypothetical protein
VRIERMRTDATSCFLLTTQKHATTVHALASSQRVPLYVGLAVCLRVSGLLTASQVRHRLMRRASRLAEV